MGMNPSVLSVDASSVPEHPAIVMPKAGNKTKTVREQVEEYFKDIPIMVKVAQCESRIRHFHKDGSVIRGELTPADVGVMQVNEGYHLETSRKLGINIHTLEGNLAYARYLYEREGLRPWMSSSHCWAKNSELARAK